MIKNILKVNYYSHEKIIYIECNNLKICDKNHKIIIKEGVIDYLSCVDQQKIILSVFTVDKKFLLVEIPLELSGRENTIIKEIDLENLDLNMLFNSYMSTDEDGNVGILYGVRQDNKITSINRIIIRKDIGSIVNSTILKNLNLSPYGRKFVDLKLNKEKFLLIPTDNINSEYVIFSLNNNRIIDNIKLGKIINLTAANYKNKTLLLYNKIENKEFKICYRWLEINNNKIKLYSEEKIVLDFNIIKPEILIQNDLIVVKWKSGNSINQIESEDLRTFNKIKSIDINGIMVYKFKEIIIDNFYTEHNNWINIEEFKNLIDYNEGIRREKHPKQIKEKRLIIDMFFKAHLQNTAVITELEKRYNDRCTYYVEIIDELNNIIDEKDKIIANLLKIKN